MLNEQISHYRIIRELGTGGMGSVYLAQDLKLDRTVALKVLPPEFVSVPERMSRFVREAKAASALKHPNVAPIYEIAEEGGVHFIAMEYVEGETLSKRIHGRTIEVPQIIEIGLQLADALDEAHSKGITHRDLKPANIMITPRGQAKLLDFGLVKMIPTTLAEVSTSPTESRTEFGIILGTLPYMSPEQTLGQQIDSRTDLFSLGDVLYEMATGRLPFSGATAAEVTDHILHDEPPGMIRFNDKIPAELERIIAKCMEKDRERRYQSARELFVDLRNLKRDLESGVRKTEPQTGLIAKARRIWIAALALLLITAGAVAYYGFLKKGEEITSVAILPFSNESGDRKMEYLSDGITESLIDNLAQLPKMKVMSRSSVFRYKGRQIDPQEVGKDLKVRAVLTGRVVPIGEMLRISLELVDTQDNSQIWGEEYNRTFSDLLSLQEEITAEVSRKLRLQLGKTEKKNLTKHLTESNQAYQLYLKGRFYWYTFTKDGLQKALEYFQQAIQADPNYALAYAGLADTYNAEGFNFFFLPKDVFPKAKVAAIKALELDPVLAESHIALGVYSLFYEWNWKKAEEEADLAMKLNPKYEKSIELNTDNSSHFYCYYLDIIGRPEDSIKAHEQALAVDPLAYYFFAEMSWSYYIARNYDAAIERANKSLEKEPANVLSYLTLGNAYREKGMLTESAAELEKAKVLAPNDAYVLGEVGYGLGFAGKREEAQTVLKELSDQSVKRLIDPANIAVIYVGLGDKDHAFEWLEKAYQVRSSLMTWLKMEPKFDPLRSDPRFKQLQARVGLT